MPIGAAETAVGKWATDGRHVLVSLSRASGPPEDQTVLVLTAEGQTVREFAGADEALWLDDERLLLYVFQREQQRPGGAWTVLRDASSEPLVTAYLATLQSDVPTEVAVGYGAVGNGAGAAAVPGCKECNPDEPWHDQQTFTVWTPEAGSSAALRGIPISWSANGEMLSVAHPLDSESPNWSAWPEVVRWPTLESAYADDTVKVRGLVLNPDGTHGAYRDGEPFVLVDLVDGSSSTLDAQDSGLFAWDYTDRLMILDYETASAGLYQVDGRKVAEWEGVGSWMVSSADGSTFVFWATGSDRPELTVLSGDRRSLQPPAGLSCPDPKPAPAPDGTALIITCVTNNGETLMLVRL